MEFTFENCSTLSRDALLAMNLRNRNPVYTTATVVVGVYFLYYGVRSAIEGSMSALLTGLLCALLLAAFWYFLPRMQAGIEYKRNQIAYGRDAKCITKFYDERFSVENLAANKTLNISYNRIRKVSEDERYLFLLLDSRVIALVEKSGFLRGTAEDFGAFIRKKAVNTRRGGGKPDNTL